MKNINQISINGETYSIGPVDRQAQLKYVARDRIPAFLATNPTRGELFIDDEGTVYIVDKGDLETYFLRVGKTEEEFITPIEKSTNKFLGDISLDLF